MGSRANDDADVLTNELDQNGDDVLPAPDSEQAAAPTMQVVAAIADAIDDDPATMPPLYEAIDTDALDRLLTSNAHVEVVFEYQGHVIDVTTDGVVTVDGHAPVGR